MSRDGAGTKFTIDRKIFSSDIWFGSPWKLKFFIYLLGMANHTDGEFMGIPIKRGQLIRSYRTIQKACAYKIGYRVKKPSLSTVRRICEELTKEGRIEQRTVHCGTLFTICNYNELQPMPKKRTKQRKKRQENNSGTVAEQNKNDNNDNNIILYIFFVSEIAPKRKSPTRAKKNIEKHLKRHSFESLKQSILNYKSTITGTDAVYRKDPANFFGINDPYFLDYLPDNFQVQNTSDQQIQKEITMENVRGLYEN